MARRRRKVLTTGAFGFVGRAVVRQLLGAGHDVVALQSPWSVAERTIAEPAAAERLVVRRADLRDRRALTALVEGVDGVCHLGGRTRVRESIADPVGYYDTNVGGTIAVLDALRRVGGPPPAVVYASTISVYGIADAYPVAEGAPLRPTNPYAAGKVAAEALVRFAAEAGAVRATILRFANAAGSVDGHGDPDVSRIIPKAVAVAAGRFPHVDVYGDGSARREYVHVLDLADACVAALERATSEACVTVNVGSGYAAAVTEVLTAARHVTGRGIEVVHHAPVPEPPIVFADSSLALSVLGWKARRSDLGRLVADAWDAEQRRPTG